MKLDQIFSLKGKTVLVTGASSGLGRHFSKVLTEAGAKTILAARRVEKLNETADMIKEMGGVTTTFELNVTDENRIKELFNTHPNIDVVINNAGLNISGAAHKITTEDWDTVFNTNLKSAWMISKAAINSWLNQNKAGNIINIASICGLRVANQLPLYNTSKAALIQLTKTMALDYGRKNIRINALAPGYFLSDMNREFMESESGSKQINRIPTKRLGEIHELDGAIMLLASDASSYMNGSVTVVDGGHTCSTL